jgi:hypothetical protein
VRAGGNGASVFEFEFGGALATATGAVVFGAWGAIACGLGFGAPTSALGVAFTPAALGCSGSFGFMAAGGGVDRALESAAAAAAKPGDSRAETEHKSAGRKGVRDITRQA